MSRLVTNHAWAALVHGRTHAVDFSDDLIAVPEAFLRGNPRGGLNEDGLWAKKHVSGAQLSPDKLSHQRMARWSLFKNDRYCAFGVTCMASDVSADMTHDRYNREIYVFLGYVSRIDRDQYPAPPHHPPIPALGYLRESGYPLMQPLYQYIRDRFYDEYASSPPPTPTVLRECLPREFPSDSSLSLNFDMNRDQNLVDLWPMSADSRLWATAALAPFSVSLCLGLANERGRACWSILQCVCCHNEGNRSEAFRAARLCTQPLRSESQSPHRGLPGVVRPEAVTRMSLLNCHGAPKRTRQYSIRVRNQKNIKD